MPFSLKLGFQFSAKSARFHQSSSGNFGFFDGRPNFEHFKG
jgi:hypothetical protein